MYQVAFSQHFGKTIISSFSLIGFNSDLEVIFKKTYTGTDAVSKFFDCLLIQAYYFYDKFKKNPIPLKPTAKSVESVKNTTKCYLCDESLSSETTFTQHHDHYGKYINGT